MSSLFGGKSTPSRASITPVLTSDDPDVKEAARREMELLQTRRGHQGTILTGPAGVQSTPRLGRQAVGGFKVTPGAGVSELRNRPILSPAPAQKPYEFDLAALQRQLSGLGFGVGIGAGASAGVGGSW